jgi:hypothetical protein
MILSIDSDEGIIKIGSPPEVVPGILESIEIGDGLLFEDAEIQGRSGKVKVVQGWDDADIKIALLLINDPAQGKTRWDSLKKIAGIFKKVGESGKPEIYTLSHPMASSWGVRQLLFSRLQTNESREKRVITCSLDFVEYESAPGIIQDRKGSGKGAESEPVSIVTDHERRGLGPLQEAYGNL